MFLIRVVLLCLGFMSQSTLAQTVFVGTSWDTFSYTKDGTVFVGAKHVCDDSDIDNDDDGLIEVCFLEDLDAARHQVDGSGYRSTSGAVINYQGCPLNKDGDPRCKGYELVRDLDFLSDDSYRDSATNRGIWTSNAGWEPIGDFPTFKGIFEGNGHTISNLKINRTREYTGLFGWVEKGSLNSIGLLEVNVRGGQNVGGLVGFINGSITNSYSTGQVSGNHLVGGLIGGATPVASEIVSNNYSTARVSGTSFVGGLVGNVGDLTLGGVFANNYSRSSVTGSNTVGGLVGQVSVGSIKNSYSTGPTTGTLNVGGLIGGISGGAKDSYWDKQSSNQPRSGGEGAGLAEGKTSAEMREPTEPGQSTGTYYLWSEDDWDFGTSDEYPILKANSNCRSRTVMDSQQQICGSLLSGQRTAEIVFRTIKTANIVLDAKRISGLSGTTLTYTWEQLSASLDVLDGVLTNANRLNANSLVIPITRGLVNQTPLPLLSLKVNGQQFPVPEIIINVETISTVVIDSGNAPNELTASINGGSDANEPAAGEISYQWLRQVVGGRAFEAAPGATSRSQTYTLPADAAGRKAGTKYQVVVTYEDIFRDITALTSADYEIKNKAPIIATIAPFSTTEGLSVTIDVTDKVSDSNYDTLSYVWRVSTGNKPSSILKDSTVTSTTLVFTVPDDWADTTQTVLNLLVSVSDGETTNTTSAIVNITRIDNGRLTTPTIIELDMRLTVSADLSSDSDGVATTETYQWQKCLTGKDCSSGGQWQNVSTDSAYPIPPDEAVGTQFRVQLTYRDGQDYQTTVTSELLTYVGLKIFDIAPIAVTEGEVVEIVAVANVSAGNLSYDWRATTGDKTLSILRDSSLTSPTLVFTVPNDWVDTTQTALNLLVSVDDGEATTTSLIIVNITRTDNGGLATPPTITETEQELTVSADLTTDPEGGTTIETYQWQRCFNAPACGIWKRVSTSTSYLIPEEHAVAGNRFRVRLTYTDGQGYRRVVASDVFTYQKQKPEATFLRLRLFLEGALQ